MVCSPDCVPRGAGAPGSAWKVSGSTGHPLLVPQPLWTRITTSIPGLWETEDQAEVEVEGQQQKWICFYHVEMADAI